MADSPQNRRSDPPPAKSAARPSRPPGMLRRSRNSAAMQARKRARALERQQDRERRAKQRKSLWDDARNLPNLLTFLRVLMIPAVIVLLERATPTACFWAAVVYALAAITDMLDGWLARRQGLVSVLGKFLDPLADKLIVAAVLVWLVQMGRMPAWIVVVLLSREITITALRSVASAEGLVIAAGDQGKLKTALQMVGIISLIVGYPYRIDLGLYDFGMIDFVRAGRMLILLSIVFSLTSAASYLSLFAEAIEAKNRAQRSAG